MKVELYVGGAVFVTTQETLSKYPNSYFAKAHTLIDRDPTHFRYILNYMRDDSIDPPDQISGNSVVVT